MEDSKLIKLCKWAGTAIEDGNGQVSIKRVIALQLSFNVTFIIIYTAFKSLSPEKVEWGSTVGLISAQFGMITALIAASVVEKKHILDSDQPKVDEKQS